MEKVALSPHQHDQRVREEAFKLLYQGYAVQARLGGWFKSPSPIHGYRPDISATKDNKTVIVEITKGAIDWPKTSALERYAQEHPEVEVRIVPPGDGLETSAGSSNAANFQQRFLIAVAKLLGVNPTKQSILYGALLCPPWLLNEIVASIVDNSGSVSIDLTKFNRLMLNCRRPLASEHFYQWFFSTITTVEAFEAAVDRYRVAAMWMFGNFKFAYRTFATCSAVELEYLKMRVTPRETSHLTGRAEFTEIEDIPEADLHLLGYLSSAKLDELLYTESLIASVGQSEEISGMIDRFPAKIKSRLNGVLASHDASDLTKLAIELKTEIDAVLTRQERARELGRQNTMRYLSLPFVDIYVATSMRESGDFVDQHRFIKAVFGHEAVKELKLRYFDPTLSFVDDRVTKGLIECLMLQRASVTLYNAGSSDTMGKDSELAATLAQGKPVIVYVPEGTAKLDGRADTFRLDHPLGLQIDHDSGVAHGILVARTPEHCAKLLRGVLLNTLDLRIRHESGLYLLEEQTTGSVLRVVTGDALLTHTFWTYFRHSTREL